MEKYSSSFRNSKRSLMKAELYFLYPVWLKEHADSGANISYASWGEITPVYVFSFITSQMLGLILTGCIFQYLKEKSGTIWIPVLVHAILDYMVVLGY